MKVVVVGGGLGGLAASVVLAARGCSVTVLEAHDRLGGKAGETWVDGVAVDTGPSVLTLPEVFDEVFRTAGLSLASQVTLRELTPGCRYVFPDGVSLDIYREAERTREEVRSVLGDAAAHELDGFLAYAKRIWDTASPVFVFDQAPTIGRLWELGPRKIATFGSVDPLRSMRSAIHSRVADPHLRALLARFATYNGSDPRSAPATLNCISHVEVSLGGFGVEGGISALVEALVRVGRDQGVRYEVGAPVTSLQTKNSAVTGVVCGGTSWPADAVVVNADVAHLFEDLLPASGLPARRPSGTPSMSGWTAVARARTPAQARVPHTVVFPPDYDREFEDIFDRQTLPSDPTVYLCAQSTCHGRVGWDDAEPLFMMANTPPEPSGGRSDEEWARLRDRVRARVESAGLLHPDDPLLWERTSKGLAERFPGSRGSLYGAASNTMFAAFQRPGARVTGIAGLYLASGSAHPGGGMPLCAQSGRLAAEALLRDSGVL